MTEQEPLSTLIIVDAHVHIHDCFSVPVLLDAALDNFKHTAQSLGHDPSNYLGILCLTEIGEKAYYQDFFESTTSQKNEPSKYKNWHFQKTEEKESIYAFNTAGEKILILAGHQVVTAEKLEVLSILSSKYVKNGLTLVETIHHIQARDGIPVLPWGFGKWLGRRGTMIEQLLQSHDNEAFLLGDNSNRPQFWINTKYLKHGQQKNIKILPGTDPLPIASEVSRPGSFGFYLESRIDLNHPKASLKKIILDADVPVHPYGTLERPFRFFRNQLKLRAL